MNPNYNNQAPYQYQQHSNGPAQPPWQQDPNRRTGWQDPRFQNAQSPPPSTSSPTYQPSSFGLISGQPLPPPPPHPVQTPQSQYTSAHQVGQYGNPPLQQQQYDTSGWGVRFNQTLHQPPAAQQAQNHVYETALNEVKPNLPPRPSSKPPEEKPVSSWNRPSLVPLPDGTWQFPQYMPPAQTPPTPPPRPPPHVLQSHLPQISSNPSSQQGGSLWNAGTTHANYHPPRIQTPGTSGPSWTTQSHTSEGGVSPIDEDQRSFTLTGRSDNVSNSGRSDVISPMPGHNRRHSTKPSTSSSNNQFPGLSVGATAFTPGPLEDWSLFQSTDPDNDDSVEDKKAQAPVEAAIPVRKVTTSSQASVTAPVQPSDGPTHAPKQPTQQVKPIIAVSHGTDIAELRSHSPEPLRPENPVTHAQRTEIGTVNKPVGELSRSGTIDSVIDAWNAPVSEGPNKNASTTSKGPGVISSQQSRSITTVDHECQTDLTPEARVETRTETIVQTKEVEIDPYADIKNEYGATLKRFAGMLRQEALAESDEEKFKIFQGFVIRELRLRSVLYGVDSLPLEQPKPTSISTSKHETDNSLDKKVNNPATDTDKSPTVLDTPLVEEPNQIQVIDTHTHDKPISNGEQTTDTSRPQTPPKKMPLVIPERGSSSSKDDSFVVVNAEDQEGEYSPGGRPRITTARQHSNPPKAVPSLVVTKAAPNSSIKVQAEPVSPGANAPMTLDDYVMPDQPASPSYDAPIVVTADDLPKQPPVSPLVATLTGPLNFQPPRPTYTPFRQNDRPVSPLPPLKERSPDETYNSMRQSQAAESGRMLSNEVTSPVISAPSRSQSQTPAIGRVEHEEAFIGLIRRESKAIRKQSSNLHEQLTQLRAGTPMSRNNTPSPGIVPPLTKAVRSLRNAIPKTLLSEASGNNQLEPLVGGLAKVHDDFGFINAAVVAWDQKNRSIRARLDAERSERQSKNESRVDGLFEDNEIGYADIGALEAEFKLKEADKKYREDKSELESFIKDVYDLVTTRIETELTELQRIRLQATVLLGSNSACIGARFQSISEGKATQGKVPMAELMDLILQVHAKIEVRHQKIAEAQFERERRRKRLELSVLYTNGDTPAVKNLEKEFSEAQLRLVADEARKKDERANKVMDEFDRAVVRGLAENQAWFDDAQARLQLVRDLMLGSDEHKPVDEKERETLFYGADGIREIMSQTQTSLELVLADSQRVVRLSNAVDVILNEADYAMYLAEEKIAKSPAEKFEKLKQDKVKEDDKIRTDFETRLSGVDKAPQELLNLVREVTARVGDDEGHNARMSKALEEAKKRNERHRGDSVSSPILGGTASNSMQSMQ